MLWLTSTCFYTPPGSSWPLNFHLAFDLLAVSAILTTAVSLFLPQTIEKKRDMITTEHQTHYKQAVLVMYSTLLVTCPVTSVKLQIANYFLLTANPIMVLEISLIGLAVS